MKTDLSQLMYKVSKIMEGEEILSLFNLIKTDLSTQIMNTKPEEREKREELYNMSYGITLWERKMTEISNDFKEIE